MRVVIGEDQALLREGIVRLLEEAGFDVVGQAGDAVDLRRKVGAHRPDVAVVDIQMPPTNTDDGLRAAIHIRSDHPATRVLVLSQYVEERYAVDLIGELRRGRRLPAQGSRRRPRRVRRGRAPRRRGRLRARPRGRRRACSTAPAAADPVEDLSPRERDVLELMAQGRSNHGIAEKLVDHRERRREARHRDLRQARPRARLRGQPARARGADVPPRAHDRDRRVAGPARGAACASRPRCGASRRSWRATPSPRASSQSVCEEVGCVLGVTTTNLLRYEDVGHGDASSARGPRRARRVPDRVAAAAARRRDGRAAHPAQRAHGAHRRLRRARATSSRCACARVGIRSAVGAPIVVAGRLWGAVIAADARAYHLPIDAEERISSFAQLITDALANTDAREQLAASRARILKAGDEERRRLGRDLHDGAQQRLVSVIISLQLAQKRWSRDPERARGHVDDALEHAQAAIGELRELAAGIHPSVLTDRGLPAALETLASRSPVPVDARRRARRPAADVGRDDRLLRRRRGAHQRRQVRARVARRRSACAWSASSSRSRCSTTASAARTPPPAPACAGSPTASARCAGALDVSSPPGRGTRIHARISLN